MSPEQVRLVQQSFAQIGGVEQAVARLFYGRLFEIDPSTKVLFKADLGAQGIELMAMLALVVKALDDIAPLVPAIEGLARRHVGYGVSERQYLSVGAALVWTLDQSLGEKFMPEVRAAWVAAYGFLSTTMIAAARAGAEPAL